MADEQKPLFVPTTEQIISAVQSLCDDELRPFGRVVLKRLREHAAAAQALAQGLPVDAVDPESMPRIDPKQLRRLCEECELLHVTPEEGKEYSAVPVGAACSFVEVCDPTDVYDSKLWSGLVKHFDGMILAGSSLPCGRYASARSLVMQQLPFFQDLSFGKICHIVQLSISQKRLLGHKEGRLVPFEASDECAKERCALMQQPFSPKKSEDSSALLLVATWDSTRACLQQLLFPSDGKDADLPLSDVKRLFRRQFDLELNETALGYTRVYDLLQDPRLRDVCTVHSQGNGQVSVRRVPTTPTVVGLAGRILWPGAASASQSSPPPVGPRLLCVPGRMEAGERVPQLPPLPLAARPPPQQQQMPHEAVCLSTCPVPAVSSVSMQPAAAQPLAAVPPPPPRSSVQRSAVDSALSWASWELVSPGASPREATKAEALHRSSSSSVFGPRCGGVERWHAARLAEESDIASTVADSCAGWGATIASDEEEDEERSPCVQIIKNTFIDIAPESSFHGAARRRTKSEPRSICVAEE